MSDYPLRLYIYNADGKHDGGVEIPNELGLRLFLLSEVPNAVKEGREVVITDPGDYCVFHAKDGVVLFPTEGSS